MSEHAIQFPRPETDPQDVQIKALVAFSREHGISSDELLAAYEMALGASVEGTPREEVTQLADKMKKFTSEGLALNRLATLIDSKKEFDSSSQKYYAAVEHMHITDREKEVLMSIAREKRHGVISIYKSKNGEKIAEVRLPDTAVEKMTENEIALRLLQNMSDFMERNDIAISFSE